MTDDGGPPPSTAAVLARRSLAAAEADTGLTHQAALLQRVCRGAADALSVRGCVIHLVGSAGTFALAASSDAWSTQVADLALTSGQGPSFDSYAQRRPVLMGNLATGADRWPGFAQVASEMDVQAVFSFPLLVGGLALGILEFFSTSPHTLQDEDIAVALAFTDLASQALLDDQAFGEAWVREPVVDHRAEVHQAQGMVMVDLGIDLAEALVRMRAHAFAEGIPVIDLAHLIIAGFVLPTVGPQAST